MIKQYLLTPGPTPIPNEVALAMSQTMVHHRTPQFNKIFEEARQGLKTLFGTRGDVLMLASSGTGAMEAAVSNLFSRGDKVLVINGGKFGERWLNIANAFELDPVEVKVEWGRAVKVEEVEKQLAHHPDIQGVMIQASETSTTVLHPVKEIANLTKNGPLFLVDGVTAVGVLPVPLDEWGIDALVTGSQKALMLPPGLGFIALSERAWQKTKNAKLRARICFCSCVKAVTAARGCGESVESSSARSESEWSVLCRRTIVRTRGPRSFLSPSRLPSPTGRVGST